MEWRLRVMSNPGRRAGDNVQPVTIRGGRRNSDPVTSYGVTSSSECEPFGCFLKALKIVGLVIVIVVLLTVCSCSALAMYPYIYH